MTITIELPRTAEVGLRAEAARAGLPIEQVVERVIAEHFDTRHGTAIESTQEFFDRIARRGPVIDASRENIFADI